MGMAFGLASIAMLFIALTSAYVVRHGLDPDWRAIRMPPVLWANTLILAASSFALESARRAPERAGRFALTLALGLTFLGGQFVAWRQLSAAGIFLSTNPHSSFFYLLTGLHAAHLAGGIVALSYLTARARLGAATQRAVEATALYWHFMDALWIYLFVLLFVWR